MHAMCRVKTRRSEVGHIAAAIYECRALLGAFRTSAVIWTQGHLAQITRAALFSALATTDGLVGSQQHQSSVIHHLVSHVVKQVVRHVARLVVCHAVSHVVNHVGLVQRAVSNSSHQCSARLLQDPAVSNQAVADQGRRAGAKRWRELERAAGEKGLRGEMEGTGESGWR